MLMIPPVLARTAAQAFLALSILAASSDQPADAFPFLPQQYQTVADIPRDAFRQHQVLYGRVEKVVDGDTLRVRHLPLFPFVTEESTTRPKQPPLSDRTLLVRLYGIDCPETAKLGNPGMPFAQDATRCARGLLKDQIVRLRLLRRDQYRRAVAEVVVRRNADLKLFVPPNTLDVSEQLAQQGWAVLYEGKGAEYNGRQGVLERAIRTAQRQQRGIWADSNGETPAEYKRRMKAKKQQQLSSSSQKNDQGQVADQEIWEMLYGDDGEEGFDKNDLRRALGLNKD